MYLRRALLIVKYLSEKIKSLYSFKELDNPISTAVVEHSEMSNIQLPLGILALSGWPELVLPTDNCSLLTGL